MRCRDAEGLMRMTGKRGMRLSIAVTLLALGASSATAQAPAKELSDKSVLVLMDYAWAILPSIFRAPSGRVIEVDKKTQRAQVIVPVETARDVIKAGYLSAQAQLCDMMDEQTRNYDALMAREVVKKQWTEQQLLYISTLHRMTIHMAAGKLRVVEKGPDEIQVIQEAIEPSKATCPDDKRASVKEAIATYVAGAPVVKASPPPAPPPAAPVQPTSAKDKAKDKK